jgi:MFS family permease
MAHVIPVLTALLLGVGILVVGNGLLTTLLSVRMGIESIPPVAIGMVLACYSAGLIAGTVLTRTLIERAGHIRTFAALAAMAATTALLHPLIVSPFACGVLRGLTGFCLAGLFVIAESWLNARAPNDIRGRVLSVYMIVNFMALSLGQLLLQAADPASFELFSIVAMLYALSLVPVALTRTEAPSIGEGRKMGLLRLIELSPLGAALCFGSGIINSAFYGLGPVFAKDHGLDVDSIATFMAVAIFAGLIGQWPVGWLSDRFDRRRIVLFVCVGIAASATGIVLARGLPFGFIIALVGVYGGLALTLYGQGVTHANDYADPSELVSVSGGLLIVYSVGAIVGPILASSAMTLVGPEGLFMFNGTMAVALAGFVVYRMTQREPLPVDEQTPFVPMPTTSPVIAELDPRGGEDDGPTDMDDHGDGPAGPGEPPPEDWGRRQAASLPWPVR